MRQELTLADCPIADVWLHAQDSRSEFEPPPTAGNVTVPTAYAIASQHASRPEMCWRSVEPGSALPPSLDAMMARDYATALYHVMRSSER